MNQTLHWRLVWPYFVSQCCVHRVALTVTKQLDFCSMFYNADVTSRALSSLFVSCLYCWIFPRHIPQWGIWVPIENTDVSRRCFPGCFSLIPIRRTLSLRYSSTFSFNLHYLSERMFVDLSLYGVVSQRPLCGTLVRLP